MTKKQKELLIESLTNSFSNQNAIVICNYKGMSVQKLEKIRKEANKSNVNVQVIKNTLAKIALKKSNCDFSDFKDNNIFIWGEDQIDTCKIAYKASKENLDTFVIKAGLLESKSVDIDTITTMAKLPERDELLSMLLNVWNGPARSITIGLNALKEKKIEEEN